VALRLLTHRSAVTSPLPVNSYGDPYIAEFEYENENSLLFLLNVTAVSGTPSMVVSLKGQITYLDSVIETIGGGMRDDESQNDPISGPGEYAMHPQQPGYSAVTYKSVEVIAPPYVTSASDPTNPLWTSGAITAVGKTSASIGPGLPNSLALPKRVRLIFAVSGSGSLTFNFSIYGTQSRAH
jgi:hypothetical protein